MTTRNENVVRRTGTEAELRQTGQLEEGQAGFPNDSKKILHRRRANAPQNPGEIVEFFNSFDAVPTTKEELSAAIENPDVRFILNKSLELHSIPIVFEGHKEIHGNPIYLYNSEITKQGSNQCRFFCDLQIGGTNVFNISSGHELHSRKILNAGGSIEVGGGGALIFEKSEITSATLEDGSNFYQAFWDNTNDTSGGGSGLSIDGSSGFDVLTEEATHAEGKLFYSKKSKTLVSYNDRNQTALQIGRESRVRVKNSTGQTIPNGTPVYFGGAGIDSDGGDYAEAIPARANSKNTCLNVFVTTEEIADGSFGEATKWGFVHGVDTSGRAVGDVVYISPDTAGETTTTEPLFPNLSAKIGRVASISASEGILFVDPDTDPQFSTGGTAAFPPSINVINLEQIQNTALNFYKSSGATKSVLNWNGSGTPQANLWDNGDVDPFVSNGGRIRDISISCAACAVSESSKASVVYCRVEIWEIRTQSDGAPVKLAEADVPMNPVDEINIYNNLGTPSGISGSVVLDQTVAAGVLFGIIIRPSSQISGGNAYINAWRNTALSLNMY